MMNGIFTGIIDRIVDGEHAVFEISKDGEWIGEIVTDVDDLLEDLQYEGALYEVEVEEGD